MTEPSHAEIMKITMNIITQYGLHVLILWFGLGLGLGLALYYVIISIFGYLHMRELPFLLSCTIEWGTNLSRSDVLPIWGLKKDYNYFPQAAWTKHMVAKELARQKNWICLQCKTINSILLCVTSSFGQPWQSAYQSCITCCTLAKN